MSATKAKIKSREVKRTWKASNVSLSVGLTAKTIPDLQWLRENLSTHSGGRMGIAHSP